MSPPLQGGVLITGPPGKSLKPWFYFIFVHLFSLYIKLKHSSLTVFQVQSRVIQLYIYTFIIFQIIFHYRLLQDFDWNSL